MFLLGLDFFKKSSVAKCRDLTNKVRGYKKNSQRDRTQSVISDSIGNIKSFAP